MDNSSYAIEVFVAHARKSGLIEQLNGKTILELGPGDSIATAVIAAAYGARAILVDQSRSVRTDLTPYLQLERGLLEHGFFPPHVSCCGNIEEILKRCSSTYLTDGLNSLAQIESDSVDLIFSQAVLEHVRKRDFLTTIKQCRRILRKGGICSHQVDLRDHLGGSLNHLRFSEAVWESEFFANSGFYTNRIRYGEMLELFAMAGFSVETGEVQSWEALPIRRDKLSKAFRNIHDEDLSVCVFDVILR